MIKVEVRPRSDNKFDVYVELDGVPFVNSNQGYENVEDAQRVAYRAFASLHVWSGIVGVAPDFVTPEPVVMVTTFRDGKTKTEQIR